MKRKWKGILAILLAAAMTLQTAPVGAYASESGNAVQTQTAEGTAAAQTTAAQTTAASGTAEQPDGTQAASADEPAVSDDSDGEQEISADAAVSDDAQEAAGTVSDNFSIKGMDFVYFAAQPCYVNFSTSKAVSKDAAGDPFCELVEYDSDRKETGCSKISMINKGDMYYFAGEAIDLSASTKYVKLRMRYADAAETPAYSAEYERPQWNSDALKLDYEDGGMDSLDVKVTSDMFKNGYLWDIFTSKRSPVSANAVLYYGNDNDSTKWTASCNGKIINSEENESIDYGFAGIPAGKYYGKVVFATSDGKWQQTINLPESFNIYGNPSYKLDDIFPDEALRKCVAGELEYNGTDTVSQRDLNGITVLDCSDKGIVSLDGIGYLKNLHKGYFANNSITTLDGTGITGLKKLRMLRIADNDLTVLPDMSGTQVCNELDVNYNKIPASEFTKKTVAARLYHCSNEGKFNLAVENVMKQASTQCLGAVSITLPDKMYMLGTLRPLFFEVKNIHAQGSDICVSVNGAALGITRHKDTIYCISDIGNLSGPVRISITVTDGSDRASVEKTVTWLPDEPYTNRETYAAADGNIRLMGNIGVYSAKAVVSADITDADGRVYAHAFKTGSYDEDNVLYDSRYSELNGGLGIPSHWFSSQCRMPVLKCYNFYAKASSTDTFRSDYLKLPAGKYGLKVSFSDGSSCTLRDKIISTAEPVVNAVTPEYRYNNAGERMYVKVYGNNADAAKLVLSVSGNDGEARDTEVESSGYQYDVENRCKYILYTLKKLNWKDNADMDGSKISVHAADGYKVLINNGSCVFNQSTHSLTAAYSSRTGKVELYSRGLEGKYTAVLTCMLNGRSYECSVSFSNGRASADFEGEDGTACEYCSGAYYVRLQNEAGHIMAGTMFTVHLSVDTDSWSEENSNAFNEGSGMESFTYAAPEKLSGNSIIALSNSNNKILMSGNATEKDNGDGSFDYTVSMDLSRLAAGRYHLDFINQNYHQRAGQYAINIISRGYFRLCGRGIYADKNDALEFDVCTSTPELAEGMKLSLYDPDGVSINGATFEKLGEEPDGSLTVLKYSISNEGVLYDNYYVKLQPVSGGNAVEVRWAASEDPVYTEQDPIGNPMGVVTDEIKRKYSLTWSGSGACSGIVLSDRSVLPLTLSVTEPDDTKPLFTCEVTESDVENHGSYYTFTFPESIAAALPDRSGLYALYVTGSDGVTTELQSGVNLGALDIPMTGIALDNKSISLKAGASAKLSASKVPSYADGVLNVTWSSSDPAVAAVAADGTVTGVKAGKAEITAASGNFTDTCSVTVTEEPAVNSYSIKDCVISVSSEGLEYDGTAKTPAVSVRYNGSELAENRDYTKTYVNNIYPGTAAVTIYGKGRYSDRKSVNFTVTQKDISKISENCAVSNIRYSGKNVEPKVIITDMGKVLTRDLDYRLDFSDLKKTGEANVTVTGLNNYTGSFTMSFIIIEAASVTKANTIGSAVFAEKPDITYNGSEQEVKLTVKSKSGTELREGIDYIVSYKDNVNAGKATATVTGTGDCIGTKTLSFRIAKKDLGKGRYTVTLDGETVTGTELAEQTYDGLNRPEIEIFDEDTDEALTAADMKLSYSNNGRAGKTAKAYVKGSGNYKGKLTYTYFIKKADLSGYSLEIDDLPYTGRNAKITEVIAVNGSDGKITLAAGKAVNVKYKQGRRKELGTDYTAEISMKGSSNLTGISKQTVTYSIVQCDLSDCVVSPVKPQRVKSNGREVKPGLTVKINGAALRAGRDYKVDYSDNKAKGTATATISAADGNANFTGTQTISFIIR